MRILYSAPDVSISGAHGGSAHVYGAITSFKNLGHEVILIEKTKELKNSTIRNATYFIWPFIYTFYLSLFNKIDLVYERARIFGGGAILAGKLFGKKTVLECIEPYVEIPILTGQITSLAGVIRVWSKFVNKFANLITITHPTMALGLPTDKCLIISSATDPNHFRPVKDDGKTVLYIGSFTNWHACENIIKSVEKVCKKIPKTKFVFIGTGDKLEYCKNLVAELKLEKSVTFTGKLPFDKIPELIGGSSLCLALFDREYLPFKKFDYYYSPIKVHEYKACGKPVIASDIGTLKTLVKDGKNGLLVNESNINDISNAIIKLLRNKRLRASMGKLNRQEVIDKYNWDYVNKKILGNFVDKSSI